MKKNLTIIFWIIIILISAFFIYNNLNKKEEIKVEIPGQAQVLIEDIVLADSFEMKVLNPANPYIKFNVNYPSFRKASEDFNLSIENLIKTQINESLKTGEENWKSRYETQVEGDNIPKVPNKEDDKLSFFSDFTVIQSNSTYISFILKYGGFLGGAHGFETNVSFNYDVKNQKLITLKDLFPNDPQYLNTISNISREYLKKQFATVSEEDKQNSDPEALKEYIDNMILMIEAGTEPTEDNFNTFTFTPDKIKIYFAEYQVGPYVIGMPEVEIDRK